MFSLLVAGVHHELAELQRFRVLCNIQIGEPGDNAHGGSVWYALPIVQKNVQLQRGCIAVADAKRLCL